MSNKNFLSNLTPSGEKALNDILSNDLRAIVVDYILYSDNGKPGEPIDQEEVERIIDFVAASESPNVKRTTYFDGAVYEYWFYEVRGEMEMEEFWEACWEFPPTIIEMSDVLWGAR